MTPSELVDLVYDHMHEFRSEPIAIYLGEQERYDLFSHEDALKHIKIEPDGSMTFSGIPTFEVRAIYHLHLACECRRI